MVGQRAFDDVVKLRFGHAHGGQTGGQSQGRVHFFDGIAQCFCRVTARRQPHGLCHACQAMVFLHGFSLRVEGNDSR